MSSTRTSRPWALGTAPRSRAHRALATALLAAGATLLLWLGAGQAGAAPWGYECFDCGGGWALPHVVSAVEDPGHPRHWSASYAPGEGWQLAMRGGRAGAGGHGHAPHLSLEEPVLASGGLGGGSGSFGSSLSFLARHSGSVQIGQAPTGGSGIPWLGAGRSGSGSQGGGSGDGLFGPAPQLASLRGGGPVDAFTPTGEGPLGGPRPADAIPEPGAVAVYALGLAILGGMAARRRRVAPID